MDEIERKNLLKGSFDFLHGLHANQWIRRRRKKKKKKIILAKPCRIAIYASSSKKEDAEMNQMML
jgi:hypothetical protein